MSVKINLPIDMPLVSVIINCFNGAEYLNEALDSVFTQTFDNWEIIFWDNASTDDSASIAKSYGERVRYFRSDTTHSLGKARKLAFSQAKGNYIAILDSDDIWLPEKLARQIPLLEKNPAVGLVYSDTVIFDRHGDKYRYFQFIKPERGMIFSALLRNNFISTETMIIRRTSYEGLKRRYDEEFTIVVDNDIALKIAHDNEADYVDAALSKFRVHEKSTSSIKKSLLGRENEKLVLKLKEHYPDLQLRFKTDMLEFEKRVCFQRAMAEWETGKTREARAYLKQHLNDWKFRSLYVATLMVPNQMLDIAKKFARFVMSKFKK